MFKEDSLKKYQRDINESKALLRNPRLLFKLFIHISRLPIYNLLLGYELRKRVSDKRLLNEINLFLLNHGGMYKKQICYKICDSMYRLKNSTILLPGVCGGEWLFQLASYKPKKIVAFDILYLPEHMEFFKQEFLKRYNTEIEFYKGDVDKLPNIYENAFDFVISDTVLEHIVNLQKFVENIKKFIKKGGYLYASMGPLWFGPGGDHHWYPPYEDEEIKDVTKDYIHLFRRHKIEDAFPFSMLKIEDYIRILRQNGFIKNIIFAGISTKHLSLLKKNNKLNEMLNRKNIPELDRYCLSLYLWMRYDGRDGVSKGY